MFTDLEAQRITDFHDGCTARQAWAEEMPPRHHVGAWKYIELNHRYNSLLWEQEDQARRRDVPDSEIAANKRAIDGFNQNRQNAIESIDVELLQRLSGVKPDADAWQNSETAGSMIDRMSILSLKIFSMRLQTQRTDAGPEHVRACREKLEILVVQRADLQQCLDRLLAQALAGRVYFKVYRQFKMYNDPALNPYLYRKK
ncbi:MAG: DUF4254 domain-containing protein [Gammaproteobacteria bacterium]|nr:DUF4254 domain-containing protein [Gammaproteobacteria bacterium]